MEMLRDVLVVLGLVTWLAWAGVWMALGWHWLRNR